MSSGPSTPDTSTGFNPLPLPKQGEIPSRGIQNSSMLSFQSAPLTEARGDLNHRPGPKSGSRFNPLPLPKQGEIRPGFVHEGGPVKFQFRSPYRSKGRLEPFALTANPNTFQSAPLTEARGDTERYRAKLSPGGFNPLPLPKQGEMVLPSVLSAMKQVSIRSPYRSKGRYMIFDRVPSTYTFQSAPLTEARGDSLCRRYQHVQTVFQSAHLTEARGDPRLTTISGGLPRFNPLPLPKQGGDISWNIARASSSVFQSAPLTEARGDDSHCDSAPGDHRFNPLPLPKPRGDAGRGNLKVGSYTFQSAPLTEARGDLQSMTSHGRLSVFQSAPLTRSKGRSG